MPRPIHARIHVAALANNLDVVRRHASGARVWSVVKANAYGHGIANAFKGLAATDGFALLDLAEALTLRELGWRGPILLLEGFFTAADLEVVRDQGLTTVVHNAEQLGMLEAACQTGPARIDVLLKINTGMNRLGFPVAAVRAAWERLTRLPGIGTVSFMSHFANADNALGIDAELQAFDAARANMPGAASLANSAAILWHPATHRDWVRPGIMLYGAAPTGMAADIADSGLQPAMSLQSEIIGIQEVAAGAAVGYGSAWVAPRRTRVAIVACGYADGYPRHARGTGEGRAPVLVGGRRCLLAGRVSMDMIAVELPDDCAADVGTPVTLWGRGLPVDEVAAASGTVGYELMCAVAPRVRMVVD